jgi:hypothetical protein
MEENKNSFIKADDNKVVNEKFIRWIQKIDQCLEVCTKHNGCQIGSGTNRVCKLNNPDSYEKLNKLFDE